jgi:hypothetical protein
MAAPNAPLALMESAHFHLITSAASRAGSHTGLESAGLTGSPSSAHSPAQSWVSLELLLARIGMLDLPSRDHRDSSREQLDGIPKRPTSVMPRSGVKLWTDEIAMREAKQAPLPVDSNLGRVAIETDHKVLPSLRTRARVRLCDCVF